MKKLILLLLFIPTLLMAQNRPDWNYEFNRPIGAFFPNYFPITDKYMPVQNTYYEYNYVSNNIQNLIHNYMNLRRSSNDITEKSYIINTYKTPAGSAIDNLKIKYNVFPVYGLDVVSSVEISGSKIQVIKLFVYLYDNEIQSSNLKHGFVKTMAQDKAVYTVLNGVSSIKISNEVYNNPTQFKTDFEKFKEKYKSDLMLMKLKQEQERIANEEYIKNRNIQFKKDSIARKEEIKKTHEDWAKYEAAKPKETIMIYYFKKTGSKLEFKNQPIAELQTLITEKANDYKKGKYTAYVKTTTTLDNVDYKIIINPTDAKF